MWAGSATRLCQDHIMVVLRIWAIILLSKLQYSTSPAQIQPNLVQNHLETSPDLQVAKINHR
jgi:hypothetical protein